MREKTNKYKSCPKLEPIYNTKLTGPLGSYTGL